MQVSIGIFFFPDFKKECPICGRPNCAVRNGFYPRGAFDTETRKRIPDLPVIQFECQRERTEHDDRDRTFTLLPECLIPYRKYDIAMCLNIGEQREAGKTMQDIASELTAMFDFGPEVCFSASVVFEYLRLFEDALLRHNLYFRKDMPGRRYVPEIRQACREFYVGERFLFGIPSQGQGIRDGP